MQRLAVTWVTERGKGWNFVGERGEGSGVRECIGVLHCVQDDGKNKQRRKQFQAST
jgi:hypothetical protein